MSDKKGNKAPPKTTPSPTYDNVRSKNETARNNDQRNSTIRNTIPSYAQIWCMSNFN